MTGMGGSSASTPSRMKDGECPVVGWSTQDGKISDAYPGFYDLLETKLKDTQLGRQARVP